MTFKCLCHHDGSSTPVYVLSSVQSECFYSSLRLMKEMFGFFHIDSNSENVGSQSEAVNKTHKNTSGNSGTEAAA